MDLQLSPLCSTRSKHFRDLVRIETTINDGDPWRIDFKMQF